MLRTRCFDGPSYQTMMAILRSRITYFLMIGAGLLLGLWFVAEDRYFRDAPSTFRKTPCVVQDADVQVRHNSYGVPTAFSPAITFTFTADGREYTVTGYRLHERGMSEVAAEEIADRYETGQQTFCYCDPANPQRAVLSLEADTQDLGMLVFFAVLLLFGGLAGWVFVDYVIKPSELKPLLPLDELDPFDPFGPPAVPEAPSNAIQAEAPSPTRSQGLQDQL